MKKNYLYDDEMERVDYGIDWYLLHLDIDDPEEKIWEIVRRSMYYDDLWMRIPRRCSHQYTIKSYDSIRFGEWEDDEEEEEEEA